MISREAVCVFVSRQLNAKWCEGLFMSRLGKQSIW